MIGLPDLPANSWLIFALTSALIELTPGPNMAYLAIVGASQGRKPGYAAVLGVALGLTTIGLAAAFGLADLISGNPLIFQGLRWAGVAFLLWLAFDGWRGAEEPIEHAALGSSLGMFFRRGLITNLLNPKAAAFYVAFLPGFVDPSGSVTQQTVLLTLIFVGIATAIHFAIVTLAGAARPYLENEMISRRVRRILSVALALIALWFAWETRT